MRARLYLFSIIFAIIASLFTYGKLKIFEERLIVVLNKELTLNSEMIIALIVSSTMVFVLLIGLLDKLFSSKKLGKTIEEEK
tara:strand:+ start:2836 stop:3081 length:246 start_codon:yes stop_codon:yes gene_type:complete